MEHSISHFLEIFAAAFDHQQFEKLTFSKPRSAAKTAALRNVYARGVLLRGAWQIQLTYRYETRDEFKNFTVEQAVAVFKDLLENSFQNADLLTDEMDWTLTTHPKINLKNKKKVKNSEKNANILGGGIATHDHHKKRLIAPDAPYLNALDIATTDGHVTPTGQKKYKQINKYIEIIAAVLKEKSLPQTPTVVDMGSGKGYLTFALYDFLQQIDANPKVFGIELRPHLVEFGNQLATKIGYENLKFEAKDINDFSGKMDLLIALHACDVATDVAIAKGMEADAEIIVVAPCCHKQIRKAMTSAGIFEPMVQHGILRERMAEMLTDTIRALILEENGYQTKVFEFISMEHTAKNVMIVATKKSKKNEKIAAQSRAEIEALKQQFGIENHFLDTILNKK
ncbi:MAG: hypothetical protein RL757_1931 [Bacteroidota bacterium]